MWFHKKRLLRIKIAQAKVPVYGSNTINAINVTNRITKIRNVHPYSIIVAIDAAICDKDKIGKTNIRKG
ncbi:DUF1256 domain-containing protein [Clostridium taeniosporum]|uniref:DUF1256 domain-containing protein n=1 Tax=Clostridium taeniosporum TaxID=394958 RepID=A0A1D7XIE9_9CLOT|nr:DUF1256 domain-containing protein [Clostridium taeniosporum]AOR23111.1 DUF1256 domain-containing protein [Clostridium taeniosporum]